MWQISDSDKIKINFNKYGKKIDGRAIAERIKDNIAKEIFDFHGPRPNLAIILVGEREDSKLYVSLKEREGKKWG